MGTGVPLFPLFHPGMVVVSLRGHDRGRLYLVLALKGETRLLLADGRARGYVDAKLKNTKHVQKMGKAVDATELEQILNSGICESERNAAIRKLITGWARRKLPAKEEQTKAIGGEDAKRRSN